MIYIYILYTYIYIYRTELHKMGQVVKKTALYLCILGYPTGYSQHNTPNKW